MKADGRCRFFEKRVEDGCWYVMKEREVEAMANVYYVTVASAHAVSQSVAFNCTAVQRECFVGGKKWKGVGNGGENGQPWPRRRENVGLYDRTERVGKAATAITGMEMHTPKEEGSLEIVGSDVGFVCGIVTEGTGRYRKLIEEKFK
jgi:hypothetical protein